MHVVGVLVIQVLKLQAAVGFPRLEREVDVIRAGLIFALFDVPAIG